MVQELLSWGRGTVKSQKLASTRKRVSPAMAVAACAGLLLTVSFAQADDAQPRPATTSAAAPGAPTGAQPVMAAPTQAADVMFKVSGINVKLMDVGGAVSAASILADAKVQLVPAQNGFTVREGMAGTTYSIAQLNAELAKGGKQLSQRALESVLVALRDAINRKGIVGVWVQYDTTDIEVRTGAGGPAWVDVRQGRTSLNAVVSAAKVAAVRTVGQGDRVGENDAINASMHARIRKNSPVQAGGLLNKSASDDYVLRLNRHPGRNVAIAVGASDQPGMANFDYIVRENKPWGIYAQVSNTGTEDTGGWRERFGFYHNQLTNNDDILAIDYSTGNFTDSHAVQGSYETPFFNWDRMRVMVFGGYNNWDASEVGVTDEEFTGDGFNVGAKFTYNLFQWRESFFDVYSGIKYAYYSVNNETILVQGEAGFLLPSFGFRFERNTDTMMTTIDTSIEFNMPDLADTPDGFDLDALGRADSSDDFAILSWNIDHSMFLEPWLDSKNFKDGKSTLAHEFYLGFRGQYAFDARLVPNFEGVMGGFYTVRGYEESERAGDNLYLFTTEYRLHIPRMLGTHDQVGKDFFGNPFRWHPQEAYGRPDWDLIARAFLDVGYSQINDPLSFEDDETMIGAGVGLEFQFKRYVNVRVDMGVPLQSTDETDAGQPRIHFSATLLY